ncbi:Predicted nucleotidyltransferase component of viral defense system [Lentzea fradiae]|uniref:Predicted nucleotidyltransferase component of viral defense system n=1 Tax=Lentzea fradiae TaxID=200378 RepID=A0A1G7X3V9_9PSEU|nr:nucleotidyl transferase AbiEii/AbiGii toxin family protein [Lentzea fradiae]SDG78826.1 Predicted nucleotidyltransferase component of viral defense system [Lentzea fradiae]
MLDQDELMAVADSFGVAEDQVRRDHLISHVLAHLAETTPDVLFVGGTALARTHLADPADGGRLSEDIDLWTAGRLAVATTLDARLPRLLRREFPGTSWDPSLLVTRSVVEPGVLVTGTGLMVRMQLLDHEDWARWPYEVAKIEMRYSDLPSEVELRVPTLCAFAAMKTLAWSDRHAARDLYDLARLARLGALTEDAADLVHDATGVSVQRYEFTSLPTSLNWQSQLSHQTRDLPDPQWCLDVVRDSYAAVLGW